jgi:hypothetical protein
MVGITRIATYFPRRRLDRALVAKAWGTRVPSGTRTVAGIDEDALTMGTDAVLACLDGVPPSDVDALYFASTSSPYREKQVASVVATASDLRRDVAVADFCGSVRAGLAAVRVALDGVRAGSVRSALVTVADARVAEPESDLEALLGDGAVAVGVGTDGVVAELVASASVAEEFTYLWRTDEQRYVQASEPRFGATYGYARDMAEVIGSALRRAELPPERVARSAPPTRAPLPTRRNVRAATPAGSSRRRWSARRAVSARRSRSRSSRGASRPRRRATSSSPRAGAKVPTRSSSARPTGCPRLARGPSPTASRAASRCRRTSGTCARAACCRRSRSASP